MGRLDPVLIRHRFRKVPFSPVHTETRKWRFQKIPLWRAFSKSCVFSDRFHRIGVDVSRIRNDTGKVKQSLFFFSKDDFLDVTKTMSAINITCYSIMSSNVSVRFEIILYAFQNCFLYQPVFLYNYLYKFVIF